MPTSSEVNRTKKKNEKAIYSAALRWWKDKNVDEVEQASRLENEFEITAAVETSHDSSIDEKSNSQVVKCTLKLEYLVWKTIEPVEMTYRRKDTKIGVRTYSVLQPGVWSNVIVDSIATKKDIPCSWVFKSNKCYDNKATIQAKCSNCSATLFGEINKFPKENETVTINVVIHGINQRRHKLTENWKVYIVGRKADEIAAEGEAESINFKTGMSCLL